MRKQLNNLKHSSSERWRALIKLLKGHKVWIQTHNFPDPDAIASAYGLQYLLESQGIPAKICYNGQTDKISVQNMIKCFQIEMFSSDEIDLSEEDYIVLVDGQKYNSNMTDIIGEEIACIDHHPAEGNYNYRYEDVRITGACSSIITEYIKESGIPLNEKVASALSYGLKMDTDSLNRGVTKLDIAMFEYLYEYTNQNLLEKMYNNTIQLSDLHAYGVAINNIQIYGYCGIAYLPIECADALIAMVSDFILKIDTVSVAIIYAQKQGGLKFSVRSEEVGVHAGHLVVAALKGLGNGGGHATMAGGYIPAENRIENIEEEVLVIKERFTSNLDKIKLFKTNAMPCMC